MDIAPIRYHASFRVAPVLRPQLRGLGTLRSLLLCFCCLVFQVFLSAIFSFRFF